MVRENVEFSNVRPTTVRESRLGMDYSETLEMATQNRIEMRVLQSVREIHPDGMVESSGISDSVIDV